MNGIQTLSINAAIVLSASPLEYVFAVSIVLIPRSHAALSRRRACAAARVSREAQKALAPSKHTLSSPMVQG